MLLPFPESYSAILGFVESPIFNSFQKYIGTTIASDVSENTVAIIMENNNELEGVSISEGTIRKYVDAVYLSNIIGYTGKVSSSEELSSLQEINPDYIITDT